MWVRPFAVPAYRICCLFQSTHPHGVRPYPEIYSEFIEVSIHAPTWGATSSSGRERSCLSVSIHAPTWGATCSRKIYRFRFLFQSTHPHGVRRYRRRRATNLSFVSIHAPTWGATYQAFPLRCLRVCFNPRTHMGCDIEDIIEVISPRVSIHAPTWGATNF